MLALAFLSAESGRKVGQDAYGVRERGRGRKEKGKAQRGEEGREGRRLSPRWENKYHTKPPEEKK